MTWDGRPIAETRDATGDTMPGCRPDKHDAGGKHNVMCLGGLLGSTSATATCGDASRLSSAQRLEM